MSARKRRKNKRAIVPRADPMSVYKDGQDFYSLSPEEQRDLFNKMEQQAATSLYKDFKKMHKKSSKVQGMPPSDLELMKKMNESLSPRIAQMAGAVPRPGSRQSKAKTPGTSSLSVYTHSNARD